MLSFSGGVDSSLLSYAAMEALPNNSLAFMAEIPYLSRSQREHGLEVAERLNLPLLIHHIGWEELTSAHENGPDRCYHCKRLIYSQARNLADSLGIEHVLDGENSDDSEEDRPGRKAAREMNILSPLRELGFSRADVEYLVASLDVPVRLEKETCLATRISQLPLSPDALRVVEEGEEAIRSVCQLRELRLRRRGDQYIIQVSEHEMEEVMRRRQAITNAFSALGLEPPALSLQPYRSHR